MYHYGILQVADLTLNDMQFLNIFATNANTVKLLNICCQICQNIPYHLLLLSPKFSVHGKLGIKMLWISGGP